jgi:hypothetical protein
MFVGQNVVGQNVVRQNVARQNVIDKMLLAKCYWQNVIGNILTEEALPDKICIIGKNSIGLL